MRVASTVYNKPKTIIDSQTISDRIAAIFAKQCRKKRDAIGCSKSCGSSFERTKQLFESPLTVLGLRAGSKPTSDEPFGGGALE